MRAILLRKMIIYCATNTDSINRIARGDKNFLKIKLINRRRTEEGYVHLENAVFLENKYKFMYALKILVGNYIVLLNIYRNICRNCILNVHY